MDFELIPLHDAPQYVDGCITILNEEWPRSYNCRLWSLKKSSISYPISLVLVHKSQDLVVGHSKLCKLPNSNTDCWLESVVIRKTDRGKGYGRILMQMTEDFAKNEQFSTIHLTTRDKEHFYEKLGYKVCIDSPPVVNVGANAKLFEKFNFPCFNSTTTPTLAVSSKNRNMEKIESVVLPVAAKTINSHDENHLKGFSTTAMKKNI